MCDESQRPERAWHWESSWVLEQGWLHGCVTAVVTHSLIFGRGPHAYAWSLMLCGCSLEILNNFTFEFVFCMWGSRGQWSLSWGPRALAHLWSYLLAASLNGFSTGCLGCWAWVQVLESQGQVHAPCTLSHSAWPLSACEGLRLPLEYPHAQGNMTVINK